MHCAGALGPEALAPLRGAKRRGRADAPDDLVRVDGASRRRSRAASSTSTAIRPPCASRARSGKRLGMTPRTIAGLDRVALPRGRGARRERRGGARGGRRRAARRAGVSTRRRPRRCSDRCSGASPTTSSALGLPEALTGPVRRGDAAGVARHLETLARARAAPRARSMSRPPRTQLPLARALGEAPTESFDAIEAALARSRSSRSDLAIAREARLIR